jgi:hypothetical protein
MTYEATWLDCAMPGCPRGTYADPTRLSHIIAAGGWYCHGHNNPEKEND